MNTRLYPGRFSEPDFLFESASAYTVTHRDVHGVQMPFIVQKPQPGWRYAVSVDDVAVLLNLLPSEHVTANDVLDGLAGIIFFQPTATVPQGHPFLGQLYYDVEMEELTGSVIVLAAVPEPLQFSLPNIQQPSLITMLEHFRLNGASITSDTRNHHIAMNCEQVRTYQLLHTVLGELGHLVHYQGEVELPALEAEDEHFEHTLNSLAHRFHSRPAPLREAFARTFASFWRKQLEQDGTLPL